MSSQGFWTMLSEDERIALTEISTARTFPQGTCLYQEGGSSDSAVIIQTGWLKISNLAANGRPRLQRLRAAGDLLGESALAGQPRTSTVIAATDVTALVVSEREFHTFLQTYPGALKALLRIYRLRLMESLSNGDFSARQRLAHLLLEIVADAGIEASDHSGIAMGVPLTQAELADLINVSRQTVELILQDWRNRGIVSTGHKEIVLINLPDLRRIAGTKPERA